MDPQIRYKQGILNMIRNEKLRQIKSSFRTWIAIAFLIGTLGILINLGVLN